MQWMTGFFKDEQAQDLIEYSLLLAFVVLATSASFMTVGGSIYGVWGAASGTLTDAKASAQAH